MIEKHIIALHNQFTAEKEQPPMLLRIVDASDRMARILLDGFKKCYPLVDSDETTFIMPKTSRSHAFTPHSGIHYDDDTFVAEGTWQQGEDSWIVISNGNRISNCRPDIFEKLVDKSNADMITVNADPALKSNREIVKVTSDGEILGIRRAFFDSIVPDRLPHCWPDHTLIRTRAIERMQGDRRIPLQFSSFQALCFANSLRWQALKIGSTILDLETEAGLLDFVARSLSWSGAYDHKGKLVNPGMAGIPDSSRVSPSARFFGQVVVGENVQVDDDAIIIGPAVIGDGAKVLSSATVYASIICPGISIPSQTVVRRRIISMPGPEGLKGQSTRRGSSGIMTDGGSYPVTWTVGSDVGSFRTWPLLSYSRLGKRMIDIILSVTGLVLLAPVFVVVAILVKLTSRGSVLFRHKREGLHGKEFQCLKFRTMMIGADEIQDKLRSRNEVDGPQFKVEADPRVTPIGKFLRDTYLDEIPQFINVFLGQMSMIGPRPSPRAENRLCAYWRDARLSVRPGVSGLWQVSRTRRAGQDFQEWIHYDIEYVRNMSFRQDLLICARTLGKVAGAMLKRL